MGASQGKSPSDTQQAAINMPQAQAVQYAQSFNNGSYDPAQDPFNYTGFTQYDNLSPVQGYDWWAPGQPTVTQNLPGGGTVVTNGAPGHVPRSRQIAASLPKTYGEVMSGYQSTPWLGQSTSALSQAIPNASQTGIQNSPALDAYINMMGGGNNYGAVIGQGQQQTQTPNTPTPTAPVDHTGTRYGVWSGDDSGSPLYKPMLPWGLKPYSINGQHFIGFGPDYTNTGLQWDYSTGHIVGGDHLADAWKDDWMALPLPLGGPKRIAGASKTPFWWDSANDPNFTHSSYIDYDPNAGYTWNFAQQLPAGMDTSFLRTYGTNFGGQPPPSPQGESLQANSQPIPNLGLGGGQPIPNLGLGGGQPAPQATTGGGAVYGGGGYGGGNPWGGLSGIEDEMTAASTFGRRRRRG